jgi:predicted dehydrogenase
MIEETFQICGEPSTRAATKPRPRLGFLGVGWIGLNRLEAVAKSGLAEVAALADPSREMAARAGAVAPRAAVKSGLDSLLETELDGLVIATPSALHAEQTRAALDRGLAVFCQKPLGRTAVETQAVIEAARQADRLLGVDFSYRHLSGVRRIRELIRQRELGEVYAADLMFHNAYGPDKAWFYSRHLSGGGCVIDLGSHLVDLALWLLDWPEVVHVTSRLFSRGRTWSGDPETVEDYAMARLDLETGAAVQLGCSWNLPAGREAIIQGTFYGTRGGAAFQNVNGSFYEFSAQRFRGTTGETLSSGPEDWGGGAILSWTRRLAAGGRYDPEIEHALQVAEVLEGVYGQPIMRQ